MRLIILIIFLLVYAGLGAFLLNLAKLPVNKASLITFVVSGCVTGLISFLTLGVLIAESFGIQGEGDKVVTIFVLSAVISVGVSFLTARYVSKIRE